MKKTNWLSFNIKFPSELIPLYDFLQNELNFILSDDKYRKDLLNINYSQHKGNVWRDMRDLFRCRISAWPIKNKTWYSYILFENIRREVQSKVENVIIFKELEKNDFKINETLYTKLTTDFHIFAKRGRIENIKDAKTEPELARNATFQLDYTVSAKQNFTMDENLLCNLQNMNGSWLSYQIVLPASLNGKLTGKVAKPRFFKRKVDDKYIGTCSYQYEVPQNDNKSILGVDIGKIKLFSAIALNDDGFYSNEYIQSKRLSSANEKLKLIYKEKRALSDKINRTKPYEVYSKRHEVRLTELSRIKEKIKRIKTHIAKNTANEIIQVAKLENCKEIHIENLSWLKSQGGKWNHSRIQKNIEEIGRREGILVTKVNAAHSSSEHPITKEKGKEVNRNIVFSDNLEIDRDVLGAINLAARNKGKKKQNKLNDLKKTNGRAKKVRPTRSKRQEIKKLIKEVKGNTQIVIFSPQKLASNLLLNRLWTLSDKVLSKSSLVQRKKLLLPICDNF